MPRNTPCARRAFHAAGPPPASAFSAFLILSTSSAGSPKSIATRCGARIMASSGAAPMAGTWPISASCRAASSFFARASGVAAPITSAPRAPGATAGAGGALARLPRVSRPGTCSSSTTWKLVPPKPNAETPARRM